MYDKEWYRLRKVHKKAIQKIVRDKEAYDLGSALEYTDYGCIIGSRFNTRTKMLNILINRKRHRITAQKYYYLKLSGATLASIEGKVFKTSCSNERCVHPKHIVLTTHAEIMKVSNNLPENSKKRVAAIVAAYKNKVDKTYEKEEGN